MVQHGQLGPRRNTFFFAKEIQDSVVVLCAGSLVLFVAGRVEVQKEFFWVGIKNWHPIFVHILSSLSSPSFCLLFFKGGAFLLVLAFHPIPSFLLKRLTQRAHTHFAKTEKSKKEKKEKKKSTHTSPHLHHD